MPVCKRVTLMNLTAQALKLNVDNTSSVSALLLRPSAARACFVFAHGAGAGMTHDFMARVAAGLSERDVATLRYQFPYMEKAASGRMLPRSLTPRCARRSRKRRDAARVLL